MGIDYAKVLKGIEELQAAVAEPVTEPTVETKPMTLVEFVTYAKEQVMKAQSEEEAGNAYAAKARMDHLQEQSSVVQKHAYQPGELPVVKVYKDQEQSTHTSAHMQTKAPTTGAKVFAAKSAELAALLSGVKTPAAVVAEDNTPTGSGRQDPEAEIEWPTDMAAGVNADLPFGRDY